MNNLIKKWVKDLSGYSSEGDNTQMANTCTKRCLTFLSFPLKKVSLHVSSGNKGNRR